MQILKLLIMIITTNRTLYTFIVKKTLKPLLMLIVFIWEWILWKLLSQFPHSSTKQLQKWFVDSASFVTWNSLLKNLFIFCFLRSNLMWKRCGVSLYCHRMRSSMLFDIIYYAWNSLQLAGKWNIRRLYVEGF